MICSGGGSWAAKAKELAPGRVLGDLRPAERSTSAGPLRRIVIPAEFLIAGMVARAIHRFGGWCVPIDLGWLGGRKDGSLACLPVQAILSCSSPKSAMSLRVPPRAAT
jgi:hypothetical protein